MYYRSGTDGRDGRCRVVYRPITI